MIKKQLEQINNFENFIQNLSEENIQAALLKEDFYNISIEHQDSNFSTFEECFYQPEQKLFSLIQKYEPESFEILQEIQRRLQFMSQLTQQKNKIDYVKSLFSTDKDQLKKSHIKLKEVWPAICQHLEDNGPGEKEHIFDILKPNYYKQMFVWEVIEDLIKKASQNQGLQKNAHLPNSGGKQSSKHPKQKLNQTIQQRQRIEQTESMIDMLGNFASLIDENY